MKPEMTAISASRTAPRAGYRIAVLPDATVFVHDNTSADDAVAVVRAAAAHVFRETRQGRGIAVRRMASVQSASES
jgi:hypothetical protein